LALNSQKLPGRPGDDVFIREVDDALRQDQMLGFFRRYGRLVLGLFVAALLALAGWLYYRHVQTEAAGANGEQFITAIDAARNANLGGAAAAAKPLRDADQPGYRAAALMLEGGLAEQQKDLAKAAASFAKLAADNSLPQAYRDLALIRQTAAEYDTLAPAKVVDRLKPLAVPGNPYFGSAGEMVAIAYMRMNKPDLAGALFLEIAKDESVPDTIRSRVRQLAGTVGVDAVDDPNTAQGVRSAVASPTPADIAPGQ